MTNDDEAKVEARLYRFPITGSHAKFSSLPNERLMSLLEELSFKTDETTGRAVTHTGRVRIMFCALGIELNMRGLLAPQFRNARRPDGAKNLPDDQKDLSNDRQVIDLHWLHCRQIKSTITHKAYRNLLVANDFNFELAGQFASENAGPNTKSGWLRLGDHVACELAALQSKAMQGRIQVLRHGKRDSGGNRDQYGLDDVRAALMSSTATRRSNEEKVPGWSILWLVSRMLGKGASAVSRAKLYALAIGAEKTPDASQVTRTLGDVEGKIRRNRPGLSFAA